MPAHRENCVGASQLKALIEWHQRRAVVKRTNAAGEERGLDAACLHANADTHDVAAAVLQRVLDGKPVE